MYLNRISFQLGNKFNQLNEAKVKLFNMSANHFEELMFHYLPKKTNLNGYGFFSFKIGKVHQDKKQFDGYGQILDFYCDIDNIDEFVDIDSKVRFNAFIGLVENAIKKLNKNLDIDAEHFHSAIESLRTNGPYLENPLKISRWHTSRKLKIEFIRVIEPLEEKILIRLSNKQNELLFEDVIKNNSSIYEVAHDFHKSLWTGNIIEVHDRFDRLVYNFDATEFLIK